MVDFARDFDAQYDPARGAIDFSRQIDQAVRRVALAITAAQDDKIKSLFKECFQAGRENASTPAIYAAPDFEEWWDALMERLRKELNES